MTTFKYRSVVTVDFDKHPIVVGRVVKKEVIEIEGEKRNAIHVDAVDGLYQVFESVGLAEAFHSASVGDGIIIHYLQTKSLKKSGRKMRQFNAQVFEWPTGQPLPPDIANYGSTAGRVESYTPPAS